MSCTVCVSTSGGVIALLERALPIAGTQKCCTRLGGNNRRLKKSAKDGLFAKLSGPVYERVKPTHLRIGFLVLNHVR